MKSNKIIPTSILFLSFQFPLYAQNNDLSILTQRSAGRDSFAVSLKNTNATKKLYCKKIDIASSIAEPDDCGTNEVWNDGFHFTNLTINPSEDLPYPALGRDVLEDVRQRMEGLTGNKAETLQFCDLKGQIYKDCGYVCNDNGVERPYGDEYQITANNATIKKRCKADGTLEIAEARCDDPEKFILTSDNSSCVARSCGARNHGETWKIPIENGVQVHSCNFGTESITQTICNSAAFKNEGGYCRASSFFTRYKANQLANACGQFSTARAIFQTYAPFLTSQISGRLPNGTSGLVAPSCGVGGYLLSGTKVAVPTRGQVRVTFHFALSLNDGFSSVKSESGLVEFDLYSQSYKGMIFTKAQISKSDLGPNSTGYIGGVDSNIDNFAALPPKSLNAAIYSWKMITLDAYAPEGISDLMPRVKILNDGANFYLAGIDIQYVP